MNIYLIISIISFLVLFYAWSYIFLVKTSDKNKVSFLLLLTFSMGYVLTDIYITSEFFTKNKETLSIIGGGIWLTTGFCFLNWCYTLGDKKKDPLYYFVFLFTALSIFTYIYIVASGDSLLFKKKQDFSIVHITMCMPNLLAMLTGTYFLWKTLIKNPHWVNEKQSIFIFKVAIAIIVIIALLEVLILDFKHINIFYHKTSSSIVLLAAFSYVSLKKNFFLQSDVRKIALNLLDDMNDAVIITDGKHLMNKMNLAAQDLFNLEPDEVKTLNLDSFLPGQNGLYSVDYGNGAKKINITKYISHKKNIHAINIYVIRDETQQFKAREVLRNARDELEKEAAFRSSRLRQAQRFEALATISVGITHDFNNLLTSILGYATTALDELRPGHIIREDIEEVISATERAKDIIRQLMSFCDGGVKNFEKINLNKITNETLKILQVSIPSNICVNLFFNENEIFIEGDYSRFHQVIANLLTNAVSAMENQGGTLTISTSLKHFRSQQLLTTHSIPAGDYVELEISDTGTGIDTDNLPHIFEPFFTTKTQGKGTGIGLATVFRVVEEHQGSIKVKTQKNKGTSIFVYLPNVDPPENKPKIEKQKEYQHKNKNVLLVDDNLQVLSVERRILEPLGYKIFAYSKSELALKDFSENPDAFDMAVLDYILPKINGIELAERFLKIKPHLLIILLSAHMNRTIETIAYQKGIKMCLSKPLKKNQLASGVSRIFHEIETNS